jgi:hypothetical protein
MAILGKGVKRCRMRFDVDVEEIAGAKDAVAARTTAGSAGVVNAVAAVAVIAAVDSSHASRLSSSGIRR